MALVRDTKRFDPSRGTLGGFLYGIARNHLRKRWEQDRRLVALIDDDVDSPPSNGNVHHYGNRTSGNGFHANGNAQDNGNGHHPASLSRDEFASLETISRVRQAIATLPENYREVVVLCELEELSYEEAASALDCPVGTIRSRLHRARALLVEKLREAQPVRRASAVGE